MKRRFLSLIAAACLLAAGCSKVTTRGQDGKEVTVQSKGGELNVEVKSPSGEKSELRASASGVALPTDFPKDVPIFPKAVVQMANTHGTDQVLGLAIKEPVADVLKYYQDEMKQQGWTIENTMSMGEGFMLQTAKNNRACLLLITPNGKETYVQLTLGTKA